MYDILVLEKQHYITKHSIDTHIKFKRTMVKVIPNIDFNEDRTNAEFDNQRKDNNNLLYW